MELEANFIDGGQSPQLFVSTSFRETLYIKKKQQQQQQTNENNSISP